jgi:ATP-dependent exoDNAse (exonuclease V) beta subunit
VHHLLVGVNAQVYPQLVYALPDCTMPSFKFAGYLKDGMIDREYLRWLYTALTRATEKVYLVNFDKKFFEEQEE